ncbi:Peptidase S8/S53 domain-containing protein [Cinnamomum micranthum f. kanehirae]|uniref:Peptidase S8/S53 domain-containing protein n=1 Tax=Cinnamomum micranthum f. kanehirae TaxID=337451 RepID=A0A3S3P8L5_9MAGN|nr:Peptidase S8/S53 domain-containing protein [Cinnamomum micranthum f. kanehirae]
MKGGPTNFMLHQLLVWSLVLMGCPTALLASGERQTYIIHMDHAQKPERFSTHNTWHRSILSSLSSTQATSEDESEATLLYSYSHVMHGFSASLTTTQLSELEKLPAHRTTYRESFGKLFTTHTPRYLGLRHDTGIWPAASYGQDVIIGIIDTGIWPESESFNDRGMSPVPERWKGICENGTEFSPSLCNRKLIGARSFSKGLKAAGRKLVTGEYDSPRDSFGHGTHTSSTAAGAYVPGADYFGYAEGTAKGVAPGARVAMYKVLWATDTEESSATDVLAGMDQAIADGVDIMSLSLGFDQTPYYSDVIAMGALSAIEKGIFVTCAAGNDGVKNSTYNGAPWIMTVGAGTVDRAFLASVTFGNGVSLEGKSYYPESIYIADAPLFYGIGDAGKAACNSLSLNESEVTGKVVLCDTSNTSNTFEQMMEVNRSNAEAGIFIFSDTRNTLVIDPSDYNIPSLLIKSDGATASLKQYASETVNATVREMKFKITKLRLKPAPQVAFFSSIGPDPVNPSVLKPDVIAPGEDVLAAWIPNQPFASRGSDYLVTDYALLSGTSMSTPHVAGVAALLRVIHKDWSPAAIRSAIMTTAKTVDNTNSTIRDEWTGLPATPLAFGAGHINPNKAMDPGLVYDADFQDYTEFLCGLGYNSTQMGAVLRRSQWNCSSIPHELNYPSFIAFFSNMTGFPAKKNFSRVVTNVGSDTAIYRAVPEVPIGMRIRTEPDSLTFSSKHQKQGFVVNVEIDKEAWSESPVAYVLMGYPTAMLASGQRQTYIIHMDHSHKPHSFSTPELWHQSILSSLSSNQAT